MMTALFEYMFGGRIYLLAAMWSVGKADHAVHRVRACITGI